jgi:cobalt-zinc-cadmium efflux system protein
MRTTPPVSWRLHYCRAVCLDSAAPRAVRRSRSADGRYDGESRVSRWRRNGGASVGRVHAADPPGRPRALINALWVTVGLMVLKGALAWTGGSLALWSDAGHSLADVVFLASAAVAARVAERPPSAHMTFGYPRAGVLVGLLSAIGLVVLAIFLLADAVRSLADPTAPVLWTMVVGGGAGVVANVAVGLAVRPAGPRGQQDLNLRSAWVHLIGDAGASLAVVAAAGCIALWRFAAADAIGGAAIALVVAWTSVGIIRDAWTVLMEGVPADIRPDAVVSAMQAVPGVESVHHVHVWSITPGEAALSAHVRLDRAKTLADGQSVIRALARELETQFGIHDATLQMEVAGQDGGDTHEHVVRAAPHSGHPHH